MKNPTEGKYSTKPPVKVERKYTETGSRFMSFRLSVGLTQAELSEATGVSRKTVSQIERGVSPVNKKVRAYMNQKYGMNLNWLDTGLGKEKVGNQEVPSDNITLLAKVSRMEVELNDLKNLVTDLINRLDGK